MMNNEEKKQLQLRQLAGEGKVEQASAMQKLDEKENGNDMFDLKQTKQDLKKALQGKDLRLVDVYRFKCGSCDTQFQDYKTPRACPYCSKQDTLKREGTVGETHIWVQTSEEQLVNDRGFDVIWREVESALNDNIQGSYLQQEIVEKEAKQTLKSIIYKLWPRHQRYGIYEKPDLGQVTGIIRKNLVAALNKARQGRAMINNERIITEKRNRMEGENQDDSSGGWPGPSFM
jgi:Zn finger protein HypA/HybF involved in hydrogenase expression